MNPNNFCIIMAGGTGSRFWPMSSMSKPKQFVDIFGTGRSMLQSTFTRFERLCPRENIIIVTTRGCAEQVRQQIPDLLDYQVLCEPMRRNTAPCIAYAAAVINEINPNANIVGTPSATLLPHTLSTAVPTCALCSRCSDTKASPQLKSTPI